MPANKSNHADTFYVGYLKMPATLASGLTTLWLIIVAAIAFVSVLFAASLRDPGTGIWDTSDTITLSGTVSLKPYPAFRVDEGPTDLLGTNVLLVSEGKIGMQDRLRKHDDTRIALEGYVIARGSLTMIEVPSAYEIPDPLEKIAPQVVEAELPEAYDRITALRGEIVDSKCFLGVMKPGDGKVHKACAELCILGGMPPLLIPAPGQIDVDALIVTDLNGNPVNDNETFLDIVAEPLLVKGLVENVDGLTYIRVDPSDIVSLASQGFANASTSCINSVG